MEYVRTAAVVSDCGLYRYSLTRVWDADRPVWCWVMLNPSTADGHADDPTVRRVVSFTDGFGGGGFVVVNLFAYRSPRPGTLRRVTDPVGPETDAYIRKHAQEATEAGGKVVVAWGQDAGARWRPGQVCVLLHQLGVRPHCLGVTKAGHPRHPLYVTGTSPLKPYSKW